MDGGWRSAVLLSIAMGLFSPYSGPKNQLTLHTLGRLACLALC
jgi:hypothetical protein